MPSNAQLALDLSAPAPDACSAAPVLAAAPAPTPALPSPKPALGPPALERPRPANLTLADVITLLAADVTLAPVRRRDLISAIRRMSNVLGAAPAALPADLNRLRPKINALLPARLGLAPKTLANLRANVLAALRAARAVRPRGPALAPSWAELYSRLPTRHMRTGLSRFLRFCSDAGIAPAAVDDTAIAAFVARLEADTLIRDVRARHRQTCHLWNEAARTIPGWPTIALTLPDHRKPRTSLPLARFPETFHEEVNRYLVWLKDEDPLGDNRPPHLCRPRTIEQRRRLIELAASALVSRGLSVMVITRLAVLVEVEHVKTILRAYYEKNGGKWTMFARSLHTLLVSIARHWGRVSPDHLERLRQLRARMGREPTGLTAKNMATLRPFYEPANQARLYALPRHLAHRARTERLTPERKAVLMQLAVALEILIHAPVRMSNLIAIEIGRHLIRPGGSRGPYLLVFGGDETKNAETLEYELTGETAALIEAYLTAFRPSLADGETPFLFPSTDNARKSQSTLAQQIVATMTRSMGLRMTAHQFRHLAAALILDKHPGALHLVQRLLGHKSPKTTIRFYAGLNPRGASRFMAELVAAGRGAPGGGRR